MPVPRLTPHMRSQPVALSHPPRSLIDSAVVTVPFGKGVGVPPGDHTAKSDVLPPIRIVPRGARVFMKGRSDLLLALNNPAVAADEISYPSPRKSTGVSPGVSAGFSRTSISRVFCAYRVRPANAIAIPAMNCLLTGRPGNIARLCLDSETNQPLHPCGW